MQHQEAAELAAALMARWGLEGWRFEFDHAVRRFGHCRFEARTISLSRHLVALNELDLVRDTILHEIAHALVGPGHGHDAVWRQKCLEVGAKPQRCGRADMPEGRWLARCGGCGAGFHRHRRPLRPGGWFCRACGPDRGRLVWREGGHDLAGLEN